MGHHAGYIALNVGIATGALAVLLPERPFDFERDILQRMRQTQVTGKSTSSSLCRKALPMPRPWPTRSRLQQVLIRVQLFWATSSAAVHLPCVTV